MAIVPRRLVRLESYRFLVGTQKTLSVSVAVSTFSLLINSLASYRVYERLLRILTEVKFIMQYRQQYNQSKLSLSIFNIQLPKYYTQCYRMLIKYPVNYYPVKIFKFLNLRGTKFSMRGGSVQLWTDFYADGDIAAFNYC